MPQSRNRIVLIGSILLGILPSVHAGIFWAREDGASDPASPIPPKDDDVHKSLEEICRESVVSILVNATDANDECDGLLRAYTDICLEDDLAEAERPQERQAPQEGLRLLKHDADEKESLICCHIIEDVYRDHCDDRSSHELTDQNLLLAIFVLLICGSVRSAIRRFEIHFLPEVAGCILVGVLVGMAAEGMLGWNIFFDERLFLRVLLPPIVFHAALSIDKRAFRKHLAPILWYAAVGTVLSSALVACVVHLEGTLPWPESLAFGALISSVDPVATLAVLQAVGVDETDTLYVLIFGEALLNDAVTIVLFQNIVTFMDDAVAADSHVVGRAVWEFFKIVSGSCLVGVLVGGASTLYFRVLYGWQAPMIEVLLFFIWSLIPYYICDCIGWSGIVAIVVMGFFMDMCVIGSESTDYSLIKLFKRTFSMKSNERLLSEIGTRHVRFVVEVVSTLMETIVFAYLGLFIFSPRFHWNKYLITLACVGSVLSRGIMVALLSMFYNVIDKCHDVCRGSSTETGVLQDEPGQRCKEPIVINRKVQLVLFFSGLRGAMSFALVENIPLYDVLTGIGSRYKAELKAMTSSTIFVTIFLFGGSTLYLLDALGFAGQPRSGRHGANTNGTDTNSADGDGGSCLMDPLLENTESLVGLNNTELL